MSSRLLALGSLALAALPSAVAGQSGFVERSADVGLAFETLTGLDTFANEFGGQHLLIRDWLQNGVSLGDLDGDGDLDVVVLGGLRANGVFRNDGGAFTDLSATAELDARETDRMAALGDYDGDGDLDVFVGVAEGNQDPVPCPEGREAPCFAPRGRLYANRLDEGLPFHFEEVTALAGTRGNGQTVYAQWNDLDMDGLLDLYTAEFYLQPNAWYRNNGDGTFTELAAERGLDDHGSAHVAAGVDTDEDGFPDVLVANDHLVGAALGVESLVANPGDRYLHNDGSGHFTDLSEAVNLAQSKGVMGLAFGDADYDGRVDVYKSNIQNNFLLLNRGAPAGEPWEKAQVPYEVDNPWLLHPDGGLHPFAICANAPFPEGCWGASSGWATFFMNADLDPWSDLFLVNGFVAGLKPWQNNLPRQQQNFLFLGAGPDTSVAPATYPFVDVTAEAGLLEFVDDRAAAVGDLDADGDQDILVMGGTGPLRYHENRIERAGQGWLAVRVETHTSAPGGVGTRVSWEYESAPGEVHTQLRVLGVDAPTASQSESAAFFGLGDEESVDLTVAFPSGIRLQLPGVERDQVLTVVEPELVRLSTRKLHADGRGPDEVTVTAFAHFPDGTPGEASAQVEIIAGGLTPLGPVVHVTGNEFQRTFSATGAAAGEHAVQVRFNGWRVRIEPRVHVLGPLDPGVSAAVLSPAAVRAGSDDAAELVVVPKDEHGLALGPGLAVELLPGAPLEETPVPLIDLGDGRYLGVLAAPPTAGIAMIGVRVEGTLLDGLKRLEVAGPADLTHTEIHLEPPQPAQALRPDQLKGRLTPRDASGLRLGPRAVVELRVTTPPVQDAGPAQDVAAQIGAAAPGTPALGLVRVLPGFHELGQADGDFVFVLERPEPLPPGLVLSGFLEVEVDGQVLGLVPWSFAPEGECPPGSLPGCESFGASQQ